MAEAPRGAPFRSLNRDRFEPKERERDRVCHVHPMTRVVILRAAISFVLAAAFTPLLRRVALRLNITAPPDPRHPDAVPTAGGPAIVAAFLIAVWSTGQVALSTALGLVLMCGLGVIDDAAELTPGRKIAGELAIVVLVVATSARFAIVPWRWLDFALSVIWLLSTTNAFNLIDGLDGLAGGSGTAAAAAIALFELLQGRYLLASEAIAFAGAMGGFLPYNLERASVFMGDGGALAAGMMLGILSLKAGEVTATRELTMYVFPVVALALPMMDTGIVILSRIATGRPVYRRSLDHIHDRLLALALPSRTVVRICWLASAATAMLAVGFALLPLGTAIVVLPAVAVTLAVLGLFLIDLTFDTRSPGTAYYEMRGVARMALKLAYHWRMADMVLDFFVTCAAYLGAFLIRMDLNLPLARVPEILYGLPWVVAITCIALRAAGGYRAMWRFAGVAEAARFTAGAVIATIAIVAASRYVPIALSGSIVVLFPLLLVNLLLLTRASFNVLRSGLESLAEHRSRVLIVGAGRSGLAALNMLASVGAEHNTIVGFADDDPFKRSMSVSGRSVLGTLDELDRILESAPFDRILIATRSIQELRHNRLELFAASHGIRVEKFENTLSRVHDLRDSSLAVVDPSLPEPAGGGR